MRRRKTWREKLEDSKDLPKVVPLTGKMRERWGEGTILVPAPLDVDGVMKRVRKGKLVTVNMIREALAVRHGADLSCPMTTGILISIAAHAAEEAIENGKKRVTPYWRTLKAKGELNPKYPGGVASQRKRLEAEGHVVVVRGKRLFVQNFESRLQPLTPSPRPGE